MHQSAKISEVNINRTKGGNRQLHNNGDLWGLQHTTFNHAKNIRNGMKIEIGNRRKTRKITNMWKLNHTHSTNQWAKKSQEP